MFFEKGSKVLKIIRNYEGYDYLHNFYKRITVGLPKFSKLFVAISVYCLAENRKKTLDIIGERLNFLQYFLALKEYLCGNFKISQNLLKKFLKKYPGHIESYFLLADCYSALGCKKEAYSILEDDRLGKKKKIWIKMANLVDTEEDFKFLEDIYERKYNIDNSLKNDITVLENIALGAQRANLYGKAYKIWEKIINLGYQAASKPKPKININFAKKALKDLFECTDRYQLELFIISGTLLGAIRDRGFIPYDNDLDTGIFDGFDAELLKKSIYSSGVFFIQPQRSTHSIRVRHVNGTCIDIFVHYRDDNDYWHSGVKMSWHNSPFTLRKYSFNGIDVRIPDKPEVYLKENYGNDWYIQKSDFDSATDCPNGRVVNQYEMKIHFLKKMANSHAI